MSNTTPYDSAFYQRNQTVSLSSAQLVVPFVLEVVNPRSVVDVGCGDGTWLSEFYRQGIEDILGLDGEYVAPDGLLIPHECFEARDLQRNHQVPRTFDLALSLEVGEHLPKESATSFVNFLCRLAPVVLFSAAIPGQAGINHVNEQWQSYWVDKFSAEDFVPVDCIRPRFWQESAVGVWYAQNSLLYARRSLFEQQSKLQALSREKHSFPVDVVHPRLFRRVVERSARASRASFGTRLQEHLRRFQFGKQA
jgi:hypothetical protein